jgi:RHS repeat-associated protein
MDGNLASIRSSNVGGTSVDYSYDVLNRLSTVTDNRLAAGTTTYAYDKAGNLQSYLYPNGVQSAYAYDSLNRLKNLTVSKGATLASYDYTMGPAGNRTNVTEFGGRQVSYTYDALYRLTGETISGGSVNGTIGYIYDYAGNRTSRTSTIGPVPAASYTYDANDRLQADTYDADGNTTASAGNTYGYDFENHLISENSAAVTVTYDGDGNRVSKSAAGVTTQYLVDDRNLTGYTQVLEEISSGTVQRVYTYGLNRISQSQGGRPSFYGYDGHGSVRMLTEATGTVTDRYDYDGFGNLIGQIGTTPNMYLYSAEQNDFELGSYYLRARYYRPTLGRFQTVDPENGNIYDPSSLHKYLYAANDPIMLYDPSGRVGTLMDAVLTQTLIGIVSQSAEISYNEVVHKIFLPKDQIAAQILGGAVAGTLGGLAGGLVSVGLARYYGLDMVQHLLSIQALSGAASGVIGEIAQEFIDFSVFDKRMTIRDAAGRVFLVGFGGLVTGGFLAKIEPLFSTATYQVRNVMLPPVLVSYEELTNNAGVATVGLYEMMTDWITNHLTDALLP